LHGSAFGEKPRLSGPDQRKPGGECRLDRKQAPSSLISGAKSATDIFLGKRRHICGRQKQNPVTNPLLERLALAAAA
jgi:hypothetical protein